jgi:putative transposase
VSDESQKIFSPTNRCCGEAARSGHASGRDCPQTGDCRSDLYHWKQQFGGLEASVVPELKQWRDENAKLKKLVADLSLDQAMLQDIASKNGERIVDFTCCKAG